MTVTYQVAGGGHLDIDFWLKGPGEKLLTDQRKHDTGTHSFTADADGRYQYCFSNEMSSVTAKTVSFNVHGVMYVEDDGHTAPIEREIRALSSALEAVKDEQEYIVVRERLHRNSTCTGPPSVNAHPVLAAESTNDRVKYWSIVQTFMLFAVCAWQIFYLKRHVDPARSAADGAQILRSQARRLGGPVSHLQLATFSVLAAVSSGQPVPVSVALAVPVEARKFSVIVCHCDGPRRGGAAGGFRVLAREPAAGGAPHPAGDWPQGGAGGRL